jgi:hypothetical protein
VKIKQIRPLNEHEKASLHTALTEYIAIWGDKQAWSQKVLRDEMLDQLLWCSVDE